MLLFYRFLTGKFI